MEFTNTDARKGALNCWRLSRVSNPTFCPNVVRRVDVSLSRGLWWMEPHMDGTHAMYLDWSLEILVMEG